MTRRTVHPMMPLSLALFAVVSAPAGAQGLPAPIVSPTPVTQFEYDAQGNPTRTIRAPGLTGYNLSTTRTYDSLRRIRDGTDARAGVTRLQYSGSEAVTSVTDPRSLTTVYARDGFDQIGQLSSPDTGSASHTYDAAGNLKSRLDSRGVLASFSYDALNRLSALNYSWSSQTPLIFNWNYDETGAGFSNGIGRLTSTAYHGGSSRFAYDAQGRLLSASQTTDTGSGSAVNLQTRYSYDTAGHVVAINYPSGRLLNITYAGGLPTAMSLTDPLGAAAVTLVDQIQHEPFGAIRSWMWQLVTGPQLHERAFDTSGRMVRYPLGSVVRDLRYDAADRIVGYSHYDRVSGNATPTASGLDQTFTYDELGRVTQTARSHEAQSYSYDANGNRIGALYQSAPNGPGSGAASTSTNYSIDAASNRLLSQDNPLRSLFYDPAGNRIDDQQGPTRWTAGYDLANRLATMTGGPVGSPTNTLGFVYNAFGQRVTKIFSTSQSICKFTSGVPICIVIAPAISATVFVYDQQGLLLGEYRADNGMPLREYIWLADTPLAIVVPSAGRATNSMPLFYVHVDHLNTPRVVVDRAGQQRWTWLGADPFGNGRPDSNPQGIGGFEVNLRFPGQYFDKESGLSYNYFRDYDASVGRYVQSDPIGLAGGINAYAYVENNPLSYTDPDGLQVRPRPGIPGFPIPDAPPSSRPIDPTEPGGPRITPGPRLPSLPDWLKPTPKEQCPPDEEFCRKRKDYCITFCLYELDMPGRRDNAGPYFACIRRCMNAVGCNF